MGRLFEFIVGGVRKQLTMVEIRGTFLKPESHSVPFKSFTRSIKSMFDLLPKDERETTTHTEKKDSGEENPFNSMFKYFNMINSFPTSVWKHTFRQSSSPISNTGRKFTGNQVLKQNSQKPNLIFKNFNVHIELDSALRYPNRISSLSSVRSLRVESRN